MLCTQKNLARFVKHYSVIRAGSYCSSTSSKGSKRGNLISSCEDGGKSSSSLSSYNETYQKLDNLDFTTAAKILFSEPPKKKRFGFDFHLVQFFFACMPSLAAYLVAQYARYEMRKMEAEVEEKKKKEEEEEKAKAMELETAEEQKKAGPEKEIREVKERLDKLEETIREVAVETKKNISTGSHGKEEVGINKENRGLSLTGASKEATGPGISPEQAPATSQKDQ